jgi:hypothetical protein
VWYGGAQHPPGPVLAAAALVLPGATTEFAEPSTLHTLVDDRHREHLTRRRVSCCYYFRLAGPDGPCTTCPRTSEAERVRRYTELAD